MSNKSAQKEFIDSLVSVGSTESKKISKSKKSFHFRISHKITLSIISVILVFGSLATYLVVIKTKDQLNEILLENFSVISHIQAEETANTFKSGFEISESLASSLIVQEYLVDFNNSQEVLSLMTDFNIGNKYSAIYLMDSEGNTLVSTQESFIGKNYSFRKYFEVAKSGEPYLDMALGVTSGTLGYYFAQPVKNPEGNIIGVIVMKLDPKYIHNFLQHKDVSHEESVDLDYHILFVNNSGIVLYSDKEDKIYKSLGVLSEETRESVDKYRQFESIEIEPLSYDEVQESLLDIEHSEVFNFYDKEDKGNETLLVEKILNYPFYIVFEIESEKVQQLSYQTGLLIGSFVIGAATFAAVVLSYLVGRIVRPIKELIDVAKQVDKGNVNIRSKVKTQDEFGQLSSVLNNTLDNLIKSRSGVEKKVEERTKELEKLNTSMVGRELRMVELKKELVEYKNKIKKEE